MNHSEFAKRMLVHARTIFPDLYAEHIRGRRTEFIQENSPVSRKEKVEPLGYVPNDLRVLWALATLLCNQYPQQLVSSSQAADPAREIQNYQLVHFSAAVQLGFWDALTERLKLGRPTGVLALGDNWSVNRLLKPKKQDQGEGDVRSYIAAMVDFMVISRALAERLKNG